MSIGKKTDFSKIKSLRAVETRSKSWVLEASYREVKSKFSRWHIVAVKDFTTLEECKIFCDLHLPGIPLHIVTYSEWWCNYNKI